MTIAPEARQLANGEVAYRVRWREGGRQRSTTFHGPAALEQAADAARVHTRAPAPPVDRLPRRMPASPLARLVELRGGYAAAAAGLTGVERQRIERAWWRGVETGQFTIQAADELAIKLLGLHPMLVWGDHWMM